MKNNMLLLLLFCTFFVNAQMEDVLFTIENAELTSEGGNDFYEADVFISSTTEFKYGFGQLYITYNTAAFGTSPDTDGRFEYTRPVGSLLDQGIDATEFAKFYAGFDQTDNTAGIISINWQHTFAASTIALDNVTATPKLLLHFKIQYTNATQDPMICFDVDLSDGQNTEACGPFDSANPFETADCTGVNLPIVIPNDSYTCDNAGLPISCATTSTYTTVGGWDNGMPDANTEAIFQDSYDTSLGNITACQLVIQDGAILTIRAGEYALVDNTITVDIGGTIIIDHQGSVVQIDDTAEVTNNGTINVNVTTAMLKPRDFMVLGNPMTADIPMGLDNPIFRILKLSTQDFRPHPDVQTAFPGGTNFVDEDNNDWSTHAANFNSGEGYLVWPQINLLDGNKQYDLLYSGGTLNNGVIAYAVDYNTTGTGTGTPDMNKNASPSTIANPYPSAISAADFTAANDAVDELYFWEHNSTPNTGFPGANSANFNMADISTYNAMGFNPASTGSPTQPTAGDFSIATGQGFGIKNNGATSGTGQSVSFSNAMRRVDNNNTLRAPENKDNIWLSIESTQYQLNSSALIGFTPEATPYFDPGYDSERLGVPVSLYSHLIDGSQALGIQGREAFNTNAEVELGFSTQINQENTQYTISILDIIGSTIENVTVYLRDNKTGLIANISEEKYNFTSPMGTFNNRFTLLFENEEVLGTSEILVNDISLFPNPTEHILNIVSPNEIVLSASVYDIRGRLVINKKFFTEGTYQLDLTKLEATIYFVKIKTLKGEIMKRVLKK